MAAVVLAVTALVPAGRQPTVQLAAWTVVREADGNVTVSIRELKDPAGLQSTLRADGVPASVTLINQQNPACQPYPGRNTPAGGHAPAEARCSPCPTRISRWLRPLRRPAQGPPPMRPS